MSRTIRRKRGFEEDKSWIYSKYTFDTYVKKVKVPYYSNEGRRLRAKYHSDAQVTMQQVPKWYKVVFLRRPFRRKEKRTLYNIVYKGYNKEMPLAKKAAKYYW